MAGLAGGAGLGKDDGVGVHVLKMVVQVVAPDLARGGDGHHGGLVAGCYWVCIHNHPGQGVGVADQNFAAEGIDAPGEVVAAKVSIQQGDDVILAWMPVGDEVALHGNEGGAGLACRYGELRVLGRQGWEIQPVVDL